MARWTAPWRLSSPLAFHRRHDGLYKLYPYNLIEKEIRTPITAHGYSLFDDGTLLVFRATPEPSRVHPVQIWKTPFVSAEVHGFPDDHLERLPEEFAAVTSEDVQRVAREHLFPDACVIVTAGGEPG